MGALLAAAFFLVEAGAAEILLARNAQCEVVLDSTRLGFRLPDSCLSDWMVLMLGAASRGAIGLIRSEASPLVAWLVMGGLYALLGGGCGQLKARWGITIFIGLHVAMVALLAGLGYMSQFIA